MQNRVLQVRACWILRQVVPCVLLGMASCVADTQPQQEAAVSKPLVVAAPSPAAKPSTSMPASLRAATIASVQEGASEVYAAMDFDAGRVEMANPAQNLMTTLDRSGIVVASKAEPWSLSMSTVGLGCDGAMVSLPVVDPEVDGHGVRYRRGDIEEWYLNGPLGVEQGFVLSHAPTCAGPKIVAIDFDGDLRVELDDEDHDGRGNEIRLMTDDGRVALVYSDLFVKDAAGKELPAWLSVKAGQARIHVDDANAVYPIVVDPLVWALQTKIIASDGAMSDHFGWAVAIEGDMAIVGAPLDDNPAMQSGSAYVFVRNGATWTLQTKLAPDDATAGQAFGCSVSLEGDTLLVGAYADDETFMDSGAAYVFVRNGSTWTQQAKLKANDKGASDIFGYSVSLSGNTALVSSHQDDAKGSFSGSAYVFVRNGTSWSQQVKLVANDGAPQDIFGHSVAISGDTALIGAERDDDKGSDAGSAYVFVRNGTTWMQQAKLLASDATLGSNFGWPVSLSGDTALLGANQDDDNGVVSGSAYVFVRNGTTWTQQAKLLASDGAAYDRFGRSVSLVGNTALIGADRNFNGGVDTGAAYIFVRNGTTWAQQAKLWPSDGAAEDLFGFAGAVSGNTAIVGAYWSDNPSVNSGSVYIYAFGGTNGDMCAGSAECSTGFCVDGVCCDVACGDSNPNDCMACSMAAGGSANGTCGPLAAGTECRAISGVCDAAEICDGTNVDCPADIFSPNGTSCPDGTCLDGSCMMSGSSSSSSSSSGSSSSSSSSSSTGGAGGTGGTGGAGAGGADSGGGGIGGGGSSTEPGGCDCRFSGRPMSPPYGVFSVLGIGLLVYRRRSRHGRRSSVQWWA